MSATLDVKLFRDFFATTAASAAGEKEVRNVAAAAAVEDADGKGGKAPVAVVKVEGRQFPVDVFYCAEPQEDVIDAAFLATIQVGLFLPFSFWPLFEC